MKSSLSIALFFIVLAFSAIAKAEEVPPIQDGTGAPFYAEGSATGTPRYSSHHEAFAYYANQICSSLPPTSFTGLYHNDFSFVQGVSYGYVRFTYSYACELTDGTKHWQTRSVSIYEGHSDYVCPSTHPYTVSFDNQTGQPTLCTDLSPNCPSGTTIGSPTLTDSGLDVACTPPSSGSQYYCSFQKKTGFDHSYQPYTVYISTGQECSALDDNVIDDPFVDPAPNAEPDPNCTAIGNQIQACPANEADHCRTDGGVQICDSNCGNYQGEFVCFSEMNPDNQDGDSENEDNPNNDTDGDGEADNLGVLQDIDKNTDQLEQIGRNQIKAITDLGSKLTNTGGTGVIDQGEGEQPEECNADNLWCGMFEELPNQDPSIDQIDSELEGQLEDAELFISTEHEKETEIQSKLTDAKDTFVAGVTGIAPSSGGCSAMSLTIPGQATTSSDAICVIANPVKSIFSWLFSIVVVIHGWSVFRRKFLPLGA